MTAMDPKVRQRAQLLAAWETLGGWGSPRIAVRLRCRNRHLLGVAWRAESLGWALAVRPNSARLTMPPVWVERTYRRDESGNPAPASELVGGYSVRTEAAQENESGDVEPAAIAAIDVLTQGEGWGVGALGWHCDCHVWDHVDIVRTAEGLGARLSVERVPRGLEAMVEADGSLHWRHR